MKKNQTKKLDLKTIEVQSFVTQVEGPVLGGIRQNSVNGLGCTEDQDDCG